MHHAPTHHAGKLWPGDASEPGLPTGSGPQASLDPRLLPPNSLPWLFWKSSSHGFCLPTLSTRPFTAQRGDRHLEGSGRVLTCRAPLVVCRVHLGWQLCKPCPAEQPHRAGPCAQPQKQGRAMESPQWDSSCPSGRQLLPMDVDLICYQRVGSSPGVLSRFLMS